MADLMPHYKSRVPQYWLEPQGGQMQNDAVPHPLASCFPEGYDPSDGDDQTITPEGGIAGPILDHGNMTGAAAGEPGVWSPGNVKPPNSVDTLNTMGALGNTDAWTTGQYIVMYSQAPTYWDGAAWQEGVA